MHVTNIIWKIPKIDYNFRKPPPNTGQISYGLMDNTLDILMDTTYESVWIAIETFGMAIKNYVY